MGVAGLRGGGVGVLFMGLLVVRVVKVVGLLCGGEEQQVLLGLF